MNIKSWGYTAGIIGLFWTLGAASAPKAQPDNKPKKNVKIQQTRKVSAEPNIEEILSSMSLEDKIGQLLFVDFGGQKMNPRLRYLVTKMRVGGLALFGHNIRNRKQLHKLLSDIRDLNPAVPPFLSLDQEGGTVIRIKDPETVLPSAMALGATRSVEMAETAGRVMGRDLRELGFTMNLAPVLDVNSNPHNPVIGVRSFGEDPQLVSDLGSAFIRGLRHAGIVAVAKHFPGHGATRHDSHYALPSLPYGLERLRKVELVPFRHAIDDGLAALMTAHIALPEIAESKDLPSTLSKNVLTNLLRGELGFDGIIMTDGLEMRGIVKNYGLEQAAVRAIQAGADMVLVVWTPRKQALVRRALLQAVKDSKLTEARIDISVRRILRAKIKQHVFPAQGFSAPKVSKIDREINSRIALSAVTLVKNKGAVLPLATSHKAGRVLVASPQRSFRKALAAGLPKYKTQELRLAWAPDKKRRLSDQEKLLQAAKKADIIVLALSNSYYIGLTRALKKRFPNKPLVLVSFGSPYMLKRFDRVDAYLCLYSDRDSAQLAAAATLLGQNIPKGKLPVSLGPHYPYGFSLSYDSTKDKKPAKSAQRGKLAGEISNTLRAQALHWTGTVELSPL